MIIIVIILLALLATTSGTIWYLQKKIYEEEMRKYLFFLPDKVSGDILIKMQKKGLSSASCARRALKKEFMKGVNEATALRNDLCDRNGDLCWDDPTKVFAALRLLVMKRYGSAQDSLGTDQ